MAGGVAAEGQKSIHEQVSRIFGHAKFRTGQKEVIVVRETLVCVSVCVYVCLCACVCFFCIAFFTPY